MAKKGNPTPTIKAAVAVKSPSQATPAIASSTVTAKPQNKATLATRSPSSLNQGEEQNSTLPANATLQQRRAHFALTRIQGMAEQWPNDPDTQKSFNKEFNSYASAMPFMIHANGLGQTAAFYRRKGEEHTYYRLYQLLGKWLSEPGQPFAGKADLLEAITQSDMDAYLAAQAEAMRFLDWVKKLASAFLDSD